MGINYHTTPKKQKNDHGYYMNVSEPSSEEEEDENDTEQIIFNMQILLDLSEEDAAEILFRLDLKSLLQCLGYATIF